MISRLSSTFNRLAADGRKALVGYLTAGDPDMDRSEANIRTALASGVDVLELGVPFSDPTADGPAIQEASQRSLAAGTTVRKVLGLVERIRKDFEAPVILFGYANPFFSYGYERICADASAAGADGFLVVDMPFEESAELRAPALEHDLAFIPVVAPTTGADRARLLVENATGFIYYIMVTGVTGERDKLAAGIDEHVKVLKGLSSLPVAVGFGVTNGVQARAAADCADGVVVGSALVTAALAGDLERLVRELRNSLDR